MNKKIVVMLLVVFCIIATILISVFGKVPEDSSRTPVESIEFIDPAKSDGKCMLNSDGEKIIYIEKGTSEYQLCYVINPNEASEKEVKFVIINGAEYATLTEEGLLVFEKEYSVTIKIYSNFYDNKTDTVIVDFGGGTTSVIPTEDNPFE